MISYVSYDKKNLEDKNIAWSEIHRAVAVLTGRVMTLYIEKLREPRQLA